MNISIAFCIAQPDEIIDSEPETEFVSTLPDYDLPSKRDKTDLEVFDTPEHAEKPIRKKENAKVQPEWDKLEKKPLETEENNKMILGKGGRKGIQKSSTQFFRCAIASL